MSMDLTFLNYPEDIALDGGLGRLGGLLNSAGSIKSIQSSDFVKDVLLPDAAKTASVALKAEQLRDSKPSSSPSPTQQGGGDNYCSMVKLNAKLERLSTGESVAPKLDENFSRFSSKDWVTDFEEDAAGMGTMHPSVFVDRDSARSLKVPSNPHSYHEYQLPIHPLPALPNADTFTSSSSTPQQNNGGSSTSSSTTRSKKTRPKRVIDETVAFEPTENDVLFGKGPKGEGDTT